MVYHGKLYGKIGNKYFDTGKTSNEMSEMFEMLKKNSFNDRNLSRYFFRFQGTLQY